MRDGILNHTGPDKPATLEGRIVRLVDRVAYINHDIDDAVRAGILAEGDLPAAQIELLGPTGAARIDTLVRDIVETSRAAGDIAQSRGGRRGDAAAAQVHVRQRLSGAGGAQRARPGAPHAARAVRPLPATASAAPEGDELQRVTDYIAGMTDRFAIATLQAARAARGVEAVMALFTAGTVERVKEASDIVEVISAHTDLRRSGTRYTGLCPFHDERSPSFSVDPRRSSTTASAAGWAAT